MIISGFQQLKRQSRFSLSIFLSPTPFFPKLYPEASNTWLHDHLHSLREIYNCISFNLYTVPSNWKITYFGGLQLLMIPKRSLTTVYRLYVQLSIRLGVVVAQWATQEGFLRPKHTHEACNNLKLFFLFWFLQLSSPLGKCDRKQHKKERCFLWGKAGLEISEIN